MKRRYPLESLEDLRKRAVASASGELGRKLEQRRLAEHALHASQSARASRQASLERSERAEGERLEGGAARAADLEAQARWLAHERAELDSLRERESRASELLRHQRAAETSARREVVAAKVASQVVTQHRVGWEKAELIREERVEEEAALDGHLARRASSNGRSQ